MPNLMSKIAVVDSFIFVTHSINLRNFIGDGSLQGGYGALFAIRVQILLSITSVAVHVRSEPEIYHRLQVRLWALARSR